MSDQSNDEKSMLKAIEICANGQELIAEFALRSYTKYGEGAAVIRAKSLLNSDEVYFSYEWMKLTDCPNKEDFDEINFDMEFAVIILVEDPNESNSFLIVSPPMEIIEKILFKKERLN